MQKEEQLKILKNLQKSGDCGLSSCGECCFFSKRRSICGLAVMGAAFVESKIKTADEAYEVEWE